MQIDNFYSDPVPSVRNPLDSIVLSPHTLGNHDAGLAQMEVGTSDYRSVLPSIPSCEYHDQDTGEGYNYKGQVLIIIRSDDPSQVASASPWCGHLVHDHNNIGEGCKKPKKQPSLSI